jgi:hypothetical protein
LCVARGEDELSATNDAAPGGAASERMKVG